MNFTFTWPLQHSHKISTNTFHRKFKSLQNETNACIISITIHHKHHPEQNKTHIIRNETKKHTPNLITTTSRRQEFIFPVTAHNPTPGQWNTLSFGDEGRGGRSCCFSGKKGRGKNPPTPFFPPFSIYICIRSAGVCSGGITFAFRWYRGPKSDSSWKQLAADKCGVLLFECSGSDICRFVCLRFLKFFRGDVWGVGVDGCCWCFVIRVKLVDVTTVEI